MKVTIFAKIVAGEEGKKVSLSIAQIMEVLKIINRLTSGILYLVIKLMK